MTDATQRVLTCLCLLDSDTVVPCPSSLLHFERLFATAAAGFCFEKWMKN
jgi:hypothetical protein